MALTNWPKVSVDARFLLPMMSMASGLMLVCMSALPMPSSEKATNMTANELPSRGMNSDTTVTISDSSTVFLRPILFINMPVGTEKMRNQKNTSEGNTLATESVSPRSSFT